MRPKGTCGQEDLLSDFVTGITCHREGSDNCDGSIPLQQKKKLRRGTTHHTWVREDTHCSNGCHFSVTRYTPHAYKTKYQICVTNTWYNPLTHSLLISQSLRTSSNTVCHKHSLKYLILPDAATPISRRKNSKHFSKFFFFFFNFLDH